MAWVDGEVWEMEQGRDALIEFRIYEDAARRPCHPTTSHNLLWRAGGELDGSRNPGNSWWHGLAGHRATILGNQKPNTNSGGFWQQWTAISNFGTLSYDLTRPSNNTWNSTQNMGQYYTGTVTGTTTFAFLRGGDWANTTVAGVFALALFRTPSDTPTSFGFRCVLR